MGSFICKQPNGLYCRFSTIVDCPTHWNMTEEDYIDLRKKEATDDAIVTLDLRTKPFQWVKDCFKPMNMTQEEFDKFLEETSKEVSIVSEDNRKTERSGPVILDRDDFSYSTWNILEQLFGVYNNDADRIKINVDSVEYWDNY